MSYRTKTLFISLASIFACGNLAAAGGLEWNSIRPSSSGIPGGNHLVVEYDPSGRLWYGAVWPVFVRGGVAYLDEDDRWQTFADWETPLPSPLITDIDFQQTPEGVVTWIGTENGIARFDGKGWHVFDENNTPMDTSFVFDLSVAPDGDVWVALGDCCGGVTGGIAHFDSNLWTWTYLTEDTLPWPDPFLNEVVSILVDSTGDVWAVSGSEAEVAQFDGNSWTLHPAGHTGKLFEGPDGQIWSIRSGNASWYENNSWENVSLTNIPVPFGSFTVTGAYVDTSNTMWFGTAQGDVISWDGTTWRDHAHLGNVHVTEFAETPEGDMIVMTPFTSYIINELGIHNHYNAYNTGLTYHFISAITAAPNGDIWFSGASGFGASASGVSRLYDNGRWDSFNFANGNFEPWPFGGAPVNDMTHDDAGNIWIATHNGGGRWDGTQWQTFTMDNSDIWDNHCEHVAIDSRGWVWFGHAQTGVSRFNGTNWQVYQMFNSPMASNQVQSVNADGDGNVWIGTSANLVKFDGTTFTAFDENNSGLPNGWTNDVKVAPNGDIWVATSHGVARYNGAQWDTFTESNSGIPAGYCSSIAIRNNGEVWIGGFNTASSLNYGGVSSFDGSNWTPYLFGASPISHQQVSCLEIDNNGDLWIGHEAGEGVNIIRFPQCTSDIDGDGTVNVFDLFELLASWGPCGDPSDCPADLDSAGASDGVVDVFDLFVLLASWGDCP